MGEFLKKKVGQNRFDQVINYLHSQGLDPNIVLKKKPTQEFKEILLGDLLQKNGGSLDPIEEAKQLKDRIRILEVICKG